ncbi:MAG: Mo-dependent nitrogenase C-terminal domain-containing protein [Microcoleaceae cyanobacterium]
MNIAYYTMSHLTFANSIRSHRAHHFIRTRLSRILSGLHLKPLFAFLQPLRQWLNHIEVTNPKLAETLCQLIPAQCPFARQIRFHSKVLFEIPPMCKINPLYEELMYLRFRAMCYLADECGG